jgi:HEAT repeat protein
LDERQAARDKLLETWPSSIPLLIEGLNTSDETIRSECVRLLGEPKVKEAVPNLLEQLQKTENTSSILVTTYTLGQIQDARVIPILLDMASPAMKNPVRRRASIITLGLFGDRSLIPILEETLKDESEILRVFAAGSLGLLGSDKGLSIALMASQSEDFSIRMHAVQALGLIGSRTVLAYLNEMLKRNPKKVEREAIELAIFQINMKDLSNDERITGIKNKLLAIIKPTVSTRWCLDELARVGGPTARMILDQVIRSDIDEGTRKEAIRKQKILTILEDRQGGTSNEK